jgi:uncharacterized protein (TIGR02301 family)
LAYLVAAAMVPALAGSASAQAAPAPAPPVPAPAAPLAPPYDDQLLRLAEILGALHYLRPLCGSDEGALWRDQMQALIDAEQPVDFRKARFVDRFNRGYQSYRAVYRTCTAGAVETVDRYLQEGERISRDVTARYGK